MSTNRRVLCAIVVFGLALRVAATWVWFERLDEDIDGYRGIAQMLVNGQGYANGATGEPTAFRPPLVPLMFAAVMALGGGNVGIAILQIAMGTMTVLLAGLIATRLLSRGAWLPPLIVAVDPLLLSYTPRVMTEVASAFTLASLLYALVREKDRGSFWVSGVCFGLAALCRPTVWAFLPLACGLVGLMVLRRRLQFGRLFKPAASFLIATAVVVAPWMVRNILVLNAPVFATTHGGYTLLLSNNPEFYNKVARVDWKVLWDSRPWQSELDADRKQAKVTGEREIDRWMYTRAVSNIRADPQGCAMSSLTKLMRLWSVIPLGESPRAAVKRSVGAFYAFVFAGAIVGWFRRLEVDQRFAFTIAWIMVLAFTGVHLLYWSNARMRAPLGVAIALLSALGWVRQTAAPKNTRLPDGPDDRGKV